MDRKHAAMRRAVPLSNKFTSQEHEAYRWLMDCQIRGWLVDMLTRQVNTSNGEKFNSLVDYAKSEGMKV